MKTSAQLNENLVPFGRVSKFIRQVTHDVRNGLSAIDLEAAFIAEIVTDPEAAEEIRKLRGMVSNTAKLLREISHNFQPVTVYTMDWQAAMFFEELLLRTKEKFPEEMPGIEVKATLAGEVVNIDIEQTISAVLRVLQNAFHFRQGEMPVQLLAFVEAERFVIEVVEPKPSFDSQVPPEEWGTEPLFTTRPGGYGLGLFKVRQIMESQKGEVELHYDKGFLSTRLSVPIGSGDAE